MSASVSADAAQSTRPLSSLSSSSRSSKSSSHGVTQQVAVEIGKAVVAARNCSKELYTRGVNQILIPHSLGAKVSPI